MPSMLSRPVGLLIIPILLAATVASTLAAPATDDLARTAKAARAKYAAAMNELAAWCEDQGLNEEARTTRNLLGLQDPYKIYVPALSAEVGPPRAADSPKPAVAEWRKRLARLRQDQATTFYDLARQAIRRHQASLAYQMIFEVIRANPDHDGARHVFGYQKYQNQWRTPYEIKKLRTGMVWHDKFGWIHKANVAHYERGERPGGAGGWISAEEDAQLHRNIRTAREIETEHYRIRTDTSLPAVVALAVKLENLNRAWQQIFMRYYATEAYVELLFSGRGQAVRPESPHFNIVYFRNRDEYNAALREEMPDIGISMGLYLASRQTAYFFAGGRETERAMYHEATHQLFQQSRRTSPDAGRLANFWLVEGIAMYMESFHEEHGYFVVGGLDDPRLESARYHCFDEQFYVPFHRVTLLGMQELQSHAKVAKLYSQIAAMTSFLINDGDGRYRDALVTCLGAVYNGNQDPHLLAEMTGATYTDLDERYRAYLKLGQADSAGDAGTKKPAEGN